MKAAPHGWFATAISEVAQVIGGGTPPSKDEACFASPGQGIPWLTPADLSGYKRQVIARGSRDLTPAGLAACSAKVMPAGAVLFSSRAPVGYVAIASNPVATNQGFKSFVFAQDIDSRFAYYQLKHIKPIAEALATGTTFKELSGSAAEKLPFLVAPAAEQKRIADKLDTVLTRVDAVSARLARVAPLLKRFRQAVLAAATSGRLTEDWRRERQDSLGDASSLLMALAQDHETYGGHERGNASEPTKEAHDLVEGQVPDGWKIGTLKECCTPGRPICYGILKPGPELEAGVPYIRVADFPGNRLNLASIKKTSREIDQQYRRARLVAGDLLLSIRGSVGRLIEIPSALAGANITQDTARLSISCRLSSKYIYFALQAPDTQRRMANAVRGVAVRGINIGDVRALQVPIPTEREQAEIVRRVDTLFAFADRLEARLKAAQAAAGRLTPALLAKAFRGELVPQDPDDEPASELLRRLQAASDQRAPARAAGRGRKRSI